MSYKLRKIYIKTLPAQLVWYFNNWGSLCRLSDYVFIQNVHNKAAYFCST